MEIGASEAALPLPDDTLACSCCLDVFVDPVTVAPCGHSFCAHCIEHWLSLSTGTPCPLCGAEIEHTALSFSLKAVAERAHGPALALRRRSLDLKERNSFHLPRRSHRPQLLPAMAQIAVPPIAQWLTARVILVAWALLSVCMFYIPIPEMTELLTGLEEALSHNSTAGDTVEGTVDALQILSVSLLRMPALVVKVFWISFVGFFVLISFGQYLQIIRNR